MARHPLGRGRLAAAAALAVLGLLLAVLGQASASHLHVEADGNLVWSSAWPDSPPTPPTPGVEEIVWESQFADGPPLHDGKFYLVQGSSNLRAGFPKGEPWETVVDYDVAFVGSTGTAIFRGAIAQYGALADHYAIVIEASRVLDLLDGVPPERATPYAFVVEVRRSDDTVVARSATCWWGWDEDGQSISAHVAPWEPTGWKWW